MKGFPADSEAATPICRCLSEAASKLIGPQISPNGQRATAGKELLDGAVAADNTYQGPSHWRGPDRAATVHAGGRAPLRHRGVGDAHGRGRLLPPGRGRVPGHLVAERDEHRGPEVLPRPARLADSRVLGQADD